MGSSGEIRIRNECIRRNLGGGRYYGQGEGTTTKVGRARDEAERGGPG